MELKHDDPEYISAMRLLMLGDWDEADKAFLILAETYRKSAFVQLALGNIAYSRGKLNNSVEYYNTAITLKADFSTAYNKKGVCLYRMGHLENSLETFKIILSFPNQSHAMAGYFIGLISNFLGRDDEAVQYYKKTLELNPSDSRAKSALELLTNVQWP